LISHSSPSKKWARSHGMDALMHNISKGAIGHYVAIATLVRNGLPVFQGYTDVDGVDLVIDVSHSRKGCRRLLSLQVKAVSQLKKGFRIPRSSTARADYYALVEAGAVDGREELWMVPTATVHREAAKSGTKSTIRDWIWKPSRQWLEAFGVEAMRELRGWKAPKFHASRVGKVGEALATAWLIAHGCDVYPTTADQKAVDLVAACEKGVRFIQVKYASTGRSFRNVRVPKEIPADQFLILLVCGSPRGYYLLSPRDVRADKDRVYLRESLRERWKAPADSRRLRERIFDGPTATAGAPA
jgi:hypothetical protein